MALMERMFLAQTLEVVIAIDECSAPIEKDGIYLLQYSLSQSLIDFFPVWQKGFSLEER